MNKTERYMLASLALVKMTHTQTRFEKRHLGALHIKKPSVLAKSHQLVWCLGALQKCSGKRPFLCCCSAPKWLFPEQILEKSKNCNLSSTYRCNHLISWVPQNLAPEPTSGLVRSFLCISYNFYIQV